MKTPKRHFELTTFLHDGADRVWDYTQEQVSAQRWKRKNRVAQLKRTIEKLNTENKHLKNSLAARDMQEWDESIRESLAYTAKYFEKHFDPIAITKATEDNRLVISYKIPKYKWDGIEIPVHFPAQNN